MNTKILVTGGTFDKEYNELTGELFFKDTHLPEMLSLGRSKLSIVMETLMMIDSLFMTEADRNNILEHCQNTPETQIIITHGTDTMVETASVLAKAKLNKTIVLTGAMVPYKFGSSLAFVQVLPAGVYIAMNGQYFNWNNVRKNKEIGIFEKIT